MLGDVKPHEEKILAMISLVVQAAAVCLGLYVIFVGISSYDLKKKPTKGGDLSDLEYRPIST